MILRFQWHSLDSFKVVTVSEIIIWNLMQPFNIKSNLVNVIQIVFSAISKR